MRAKPVRRRNTMNERDVLIPVDSNCATMWTLSADRRSVRLAPPPLRLAGILGSLLVYMDFDAESVDAML